MGTRTELKMTPRRLRPAFDRLDPRLALSGATAGLLAGLQAAGQAAGSPTTSTTLSVVSTTPARSAVLQASLGSLQITFDRPLLDYSVGTNDFDLVHVAGDGTASPLGRGEAAVSESLDPSDPTGSRVELTLSRALTPGHYRLVVDPSFQILGRDGSALVAGGSGVVLDDFAIAKTDSGLAGATEVGTLGPQVVSVPGVLDLSSDPGAVRYEKFELAAGHHWLVGLEISAHRDGGSLDSSISLFDSQGRPIATSNQGLPGGTGDPYLFQGLDAGTYYVGIAASKNVPTASGTYDEATSAPGLPDSGGPFHLSLVADPADQAARLTGLRVDHADPLSTSPTGLTLQFSAGLAVQSLHGTSGPALDLVDQDGNRWPLAPIGYDASHAQLALAFGRSLPAGTYTVALAGPNSLLDLAGDQPIASGQPSGTLGTFIVAPSVPVSGDLGTILPGVGASVTTRASVRPGEPTTEQFVVLGPGVYVVEGVTIASSIKFSIEDGSGNVLNAGPEATPDGATNLILPAGVYRMVLTTDGPPSEVSITIHPSASQASSLLDGGVAQGPALGLRLVTPQAGFGAGVGVGVGVGVASVGRGVVEVGSMTAPAASASSATLPMAAVPASGGRAMISGPTTIVGTATPSGPSVAGLLSGVTPVGMPSSQANPITIVGTTGPSGLASIASNAPGLAEGLMAAPVPIDGEGTPEVASRGPNADPHADSSAGLRAGITLEAGLLARAPASRREDDRTLADAEGLGQLLAAALGWFEGSPDASEVAAGGGTVPIAPNAPLASEGARPEENRVESASLTSPLGIGIALGAIAYGYRHKLAAGRPIARKVGPHGEPRPILTGPHRLAKIRVR